MLDKTKRRMILAGKVLMGRDLAPSSQREVLNLTKDEVEEARAFFPMDKFFMFGHARSGTTLLARLVRLHPEVHCNWQAHFFTRSPLLQSLVNDEEVRSWLSRRSNRWNRQGDLSAVVLRAVSDFILERDARHEGKNIVGDKSPNSLLNGEAVRKLFKIYPDGRLIFLVRDGRDVVLSHRIQSFIDNAHTLNLEDKQIRQSFIQNPEPYLSGRRSLFSRKGIMHSAHGWVDNVIETDGLGRQLFGDRYLALRFEDLVANPWDEMVRLWSFLGAATSIPGLREKVNNELTRNPDADWQREKANLIAKSLVKGKHGSWREMFTQQDIETFYQIARDTLNHWDYDIGIPQAENRAEL